jgi:hypothetical protein
MDMPPNDQSPLSPHRVFVVQLREQVDVEKGQWAGKVEHVTSAQSTHFQSVVEMVTFITRIAASAHKRPLDE